MRWAKTLEDAEGGADCVSVETFAALVSGGMAAGADVLVSMLLSEFVLGVDAEAGQLGIAIFFVKMLLEGAAWASSTSAQLPCGCSSPLC